MKPAIERGKLRAPCATCDREIAARDLRLAEPCNDGRIPNARLRYHHLECAIVALPRVVREALIASSDAVGDPARLYRRLQDLIEDSEEPVAPVASAPKRPAATDENSPMACAGSARMHHRSRATSARETSRGERGGAPTAAPPHR
jgi:hypothetical protein